MKGITVTVDTTPQRAEQLARDAPGTDRPRRRRCRFERAAGGSAEGFGVLTEIDVAATFADKLGITRPALKILGACNPRFAHTAISHDPPVALLLPCNVVIEETDHGVTITAADPRQLLDGPCLDELASDAAGRITRALEAVGDHSGPGTTTGSP